jgi:predicted SAM-dependent methyltransferase
MNDPVKLNVGCGPTVADGWINIDKSPSVFLSPFPKLRKALLAARVLARAQADGFPAGVVHANVARRIPATDHSVAFVYSSHMIEHLSRWEGLRFIGECRRVLQPGGVLRIATPDLRLIIDDYLNGTSPMLRDCQTPADAFCREYGAFANAQVNPVKAIVRRLFSGDSHQWLYDHASLAAALHEGGFSEVTPCSYRQGITPDLAAVEHRPRGLFIEARRA